MTVLYSDIPPVALPVGEKTIREFFHESVEQSDQIIIATGYASKNSLIELDEIVRQCHIKKTVVVLGMYYIDGIPESIYNTAIRVNEEWIRDGIGEIRIIKSTKYHAKLYCFFKNEQLFTAIVGSNNLGTISIDASNRRQYELAVAVRDSHDCQSISQHLEKICRDPVSYLISGVNDLKIVHEENQKLVDVEGVTKVGQADVDIYKNAQTQTVFEIPLKVPGLPGSTNDYMKSNINKCYAKGRLNSRTGVVTERGWWETEIIVPITVTSLPDYPEKSKPFVVVTDDGWMFNAHVSGDHKKNFESDYNLKVLGYWLKGRLVASGLIDPVDSPSKDLENKLNTGEDVYKNCRGVITYQKLLKYGRVSITLTKTTRQHTDENGSQLDVWFVSFLPANVK